MMKLLLYAICAAVLLFGGVGCTTEGGQGASPSIVTVQYLNPETFSDFSVPGRDVQNSTSAFTQEVTRSLVPVMENRFSGDLLTLRFTDINQAGGRASVRASTVRVVRNRTPSRLSFNYALLDKSGRSVASGSQRLVDNGHRTVSNNLSRSRPFINEGRMLQRWLQSLSVTR